MVLAGEVFINDEQIWRDDSLVEPLSRSWNMPRLLRFSEPDLRDGVNSIRIHVVSVPGQPLGLGSVFLGATPQMQEIYEGLQWHNRTLFSINLIVSGVLGIFFLALWAAHRNETAYGWYALSTLFWLIFASKIVAVSPWPFADSASAVVVYHASLVLTISRFCVFSWRLSEQKFPQLERGLVVLHCHCIAHFDSDAIYLCGTHTYSRGAGVHSYFLMQLFGDAVSCLADAQSGAYSIGRLFDGLVDHYSA